MYGKFQNWSSTLDLHGPSIEKELFAYLVEMFQSGKRSSPGTLGCRFSMLRNVLLSLDGVGIKDIDINDTYMTQADRSSAQDQKGAYVHQRGGEALYKNAPSTMIDHKFILLVGVYTGLWCETIARLEWGHIDLSQPAVHIYVDYDTRRTNTQPTCGFHIRERLTAQICVL
jgi:hypothetical protein